MPWSPELNCIEAQEAEKLKALHESIINGLKYGSRPGDRNAKMFYPNNDGECNIIKNLIMTGDEIDLEKILCLHILSVMPAPVYCNKFITSGPANDLNPYSSVLPTFITTTKDETAFLCKCWNTENKSKIGKLRPYRTHLALNRRLVEIIAIALNILSETNLEKLQKLCEYSHSLEFIKSLLDKEKNLIFIAALNRTGRLQVFSDLQVEPCIVIKATRRILYELEKPKRNLVFSIKLSHSLLLRSDEKGKYNGLKYSQGFLKNKINIYANSLEQNSGLSYSRPLKPKCRKYRAMSLIEPLLNKKLLNIDKELQQVKQFNDKYLQSEEENKSNNTLQKELQIPKSVMNNNSYSRKNKHVTFGKDKCSKNKHLFPQIKPRRSTPSKDAANNKLIPDSSKTPAEHVVDKCGARSEGVSLHQLDYGKAIYYNKRSRKIKENIQGNFKERHEDVGHGNRNVLKIPSTEDILPVNKELTKIRNKLRLNQLLKSVEKLKPSPEEQFIDIQGEDICSKEVLIHAVSNMEHNPDHDIHWRNNATAFLHVRIQKMYACCLTCYNPDRQMLALILLPCVTGFACLSWKLWKKLHSIPTFCCQDSCQNSPLSNPTLSSVDPALYQQYLNEAYADCMVDTYIYGYLRKIIPDQGSIEERGLKNRIIEYKDYHSLSDEEFPFNKMFIYIPASGYIPTLLDKVEPGRIEMRSNEQFEPLVLNRAGVGKRVYKSAVYKIYFPGDSSKHITVAMEGAPPLLCLSDSCKENAELRKHKKELIYLFYTKLKAKIEEHEEFEDSCELIYWEEDKKSLADYLILRFIEKKQWN